MYHKAYFVDMWASVPRPVNEKTLEFFGQLQVDNCQTVSFVYTVLGNLQVLLCRISVEIIWLNKSANKSDFMKIINH